MKKIINTRKTWTVTAAFFITTLLVGSIVTAQDNLAFAGGDHKKKKSNQAEQGISQIQGLDQTATVSSGGETLASGNNLGFLLNLNEGNNALGQQ